MFTHTSLPSQFLGSFSHPSHTLTHTFTCTSNPHLRLYTTRLTPSVTTPTGTLLIIHGLGEHSGRFMHVAEFFCSLNYEILMVDMRGFGYSGGARGCSEVEELQLDVLEVVRMADQRLPLYVYGHSLGALVVVTMCYQYTDLRIAGVVLTSPLLGMPIGFKLSWVRDKIVRWIGGKIDDFVVNSAINPTSLTKSNTHIQTIYGDRLMVPFLTVKMGRSVMLSIEKIQKNASEITVPIFIFHGKQDSVTNYQDSLHFIENVSSKIKNLHLFETGYHQLHHDEQCKQMLSLMSKWLESLPATPLGHPNLQRRRHPNPKIPYLLLIFLLLYLLSAIKLSRKPTLLPANPHRRHPLLQLLHFLLSPILSLL